MRMFKRMSLMFAALILLYFVLLMSVFAIPNDCVVDNVNAAIGVLREEGEYPHYFFGYPFGQADNSTDIQMYTNMLADEASTLPQASMIPQYARYWHGYAVVLRPLSAFLSITSIRYLNMALMTVLLCLCFHKIAERLCAAAGVAFVLGLVASFFWLAPFNFQYCVITALTLVFSLTVVLGYKRWRSDAMPLLFMCFGSLTNFFDFLTFPILSLGYPLILLLLLRKRDSRRTFASESLLLLQCSASWLAGYLLTLLAKGALGNLLTGTNVMRDILDNALYRIGGSLPEGYEAGISAWMSLHYNIAVFFNPRTLIVFLLCVAGLGLLAIRRRRVLGGWLASLPLIFVALYPYIWYAVLQNHSIMHCYFTFKSQSVTFFALCAYLISVIYIPENRQSAALSGKPEP